MQVENWLSVAKLFFLANLFRAAISTHGHGNAQYLQISNNVTTLTVKYLFAKLNTRETFLTKNVCDIKYLYKKDHILEFVTFFFTLVI